MSEQLTAPEALATAAAEPTMDEYLRRDPATLTPQDLRKIVELERKKRAMFIEQDKVKKEKGGEDAEAEGEA